MQKYFFVRINGKYLKINFQEILYVEGCRNYIKIVTEGRSHLVLFSMKGMEKLLPSYLFKRIHKSFIVSLDKIISFDADTVFLKGKELPMGQQYRSQLEKAVVIFSYVAEEPETVNSFYSVPLELNRTAMNTLVEAG